MTRQNDKEGFLHDADASSDERLAILRMKFGWAGIGIYWFLIEQLRKSTNLELSMKSIPALAFATNTSEADLSAVVLAGIEVGAFARNGDNFFSPSLTRRIEKFRGAQESYRLQKVEAGRASALARNAVPTAFQRRSNVVRTTNIKENTNEKKGKGCGERETIELGSPPETSLLISASKHAALVSEFGAEAVKVEGDTAARHIPNAKRPYKDLDQFFHNWLKRAKLERMGYFAPIRTALTQSRQKLTSAQIALNELAPHYLEGEQLDTYLKAEK